MSKNKFPPKHRKTEESEGGGPVFLYGLHTVRAALDNPERRKVRLLATPNAVDRLGGADSLAGMIPESVTPKQLDQMLGQDTVHQGVALEVDPVDRARLRDFDRLKLVVVLDQVTDPHNVGAILRTACAFGADAVITTARYAPRETGVLAKSASGALDMIRFIEVRNLGNAIEELRNHGIFCLGFDSEAETVLKPGLSHERVAIILGAEGKGLRQRTREVCNELVRLDMPGEIKSLNVSNAAAIALFAVTFSTP